MSPEDRRRLTLATIVTLVALPALWLMQTDNTAPGSPSVAAVGAPAPGGSSDAGTPDTEPPAPAYLEGPSTTLGDGTATSVVIATGEADGPNRISGTASYRRFDPQNYPAGSCQVRGAPLGATITIRNVDNDRTTSCVNVSTYVAEKGDVAVIDTGVFLQVADLVDAPLPVELTW